MNISRQDFYVHPKYYNIYTLNITGTGHEDQYNFLMPVMKALVDKTRGLLDMDALLPQLPTTFMSPTFYDDFKVYSQSSEWRNFMEKMVWNKSLHSHSKQQVPFILRIDKIYKRDHRIQNGSL